MLVVVVVLALIAAIVATRWSSLHHRAVGESAIGRLEFVDQHLRQFARSRGQGCELAFDLDRHRIRKRYRDDESESPAWETLGTGVELRSIRIGGEKPTNRTVEVRFDVNGQSPAYGLHLVGPGERDSWLVFAGVSGQMTQCASEAAWNGAFELLQPPGL
jgi:type II secretory pathway pseudopilin PulG